MRLSLILMSPGEDSGGGPADQGGAVALATGPDRDVRPEGLDGIAEALRTRDAAHAQEIAEKDRKAAELDRAYRSALREREIAVALVGQPLVAGAAAQLIRLWQDDFDVVDDGAGVRILARDGRGVGQAISDRLSGPEFAHFCLPTSRGGTGSRGQDRAAAPLPRQVGPRTLGEAAVMRWRDADPSPGGTPGVGWGRGR